MDGPTGRYRKLNIYFIREKNNYKVTFGDKIRDDARAWSSYKNKFTIAGYSHVKTKKKSTFKENKVIKDLKRNIKLNVSDLMENIGEKVTIEAFSIK